MYLVMKCRKVTYHNYLDNMKKVMLIVMAALISSVAVAATITGKVAKTSGSMTVSVYTLDGSIIHQHTYCGNRFRIDLPDDEYYTVVFEDVKGQRKVLYLDTHDAWLVLNVKIYINRPDTYLRWVNNIPVHEYITHNHQYSLHFKFLIL